MMKGHGVDPNADMHNCIMCIFPLAGGDGPNISSSHLNYLSYPDSEYDLQIIILFVYILALPSQTSSFNCVLCLS